MSFLRQPGRLAVEGLSHQFADGVWGLEDIWLAFDRGQFAVVAGPNGAGKTLLMKHLVGLSAPTRGTVRLDGVEITRHLGEVRRRVGLVFQDSGAQIVGLTVEEEVAFGPRNLGWTKQATQASVGQALEAVGLEGRREEVCAHLSGGEKRRLAIAGVLACGPEILILDEPFTGLDLPAVQAVLATLLELHRNGKTIILLTHELEKCLAHAERLILMVDRKILADGRPAELWERIPEANAHRPSGGPQRIPEMTWLV